MIILIFFNETYRKIRIFTSLATNEMNEHTIFMHEKRFLMNERLFAYVKIGQPSTTLSGGGELICCGTPEEVAKNKKSYTAEFLRKEGIE